MKLKQYAKNLNEFIKENPQALDMDVVTSIDDEGNGFNNVHFTPSTGLLEDGEFDSEADKEIHNSVCLN